MYTVSGALALALKTGMRQVTHYVELWQGGAKKATVELLSGTVSQERTAAIRTTCDITIAGWQAFTPEEGVLGVTRLYGDDLYGDGIYGDLQRRVLQGLLLPLATELRIYAVYTEPDNTATTIPLGRFTCGNPTFDDGADGSQAIKVSGWDMAGDVTLARIATPYVIAAGTNVGTALGAYLNSRIGSHTLTAPATTVTSARRVFLPGDDLDPWEIASQIAALAGWQVYANRTGGWTAEALPGVVPLGTPDWEVSDLVNAQSFGYTMDGAAIRNRVVVIVNRPDNQPPLQVVATDTAGPYGTTALGRTVATVIKDSAIVDASHAAARANTELDKLRHVRETLEVATMPCPHLDAGDTVIAVSEGLEILDDYMWTVESVKYGLDVTAATSLTLSREVA